MLYNPLKYSVEVLQSMFEEIYIMTSNLELLSIKLHSFLFWMTPQLSTLVKYQISTYTPTIDMFLLIIY